MLAAYTCGSHDSALPVDTKEALHLALVGQTPSAAFSLDTEEVRQACSLFDCAL